MQQLLQLLSDGRDLTAAQMTTAMSTIMDGQATPAQIGGFLMALRVKGETVEEIAAAAQVMRERAEKVNVEPSHLVDTCGTGGDSRGTFNVSTACAFVAAEAGAKVAKHGNRSVSSKSGSADVLEEAGVNLETSPEQVAECIDQYGVGFLFAPRHHGATRHAVGPRKELGVRTMFNLLGPLTNPAAAPNQVLGVFDVRWVRPVAEVLRELGSRHVMVVHSQDGMDEISIGAPTQVSELKDGSITDYVLEPQDYGVPRQSLDELAADGAIPSLKLIKKALTGANQAASDIVSLNAGAAIYVAGLADTLTAGIERARSIQSQRCAWERLQDFAAFTRQY